LKQMKKPHTSMESRRNRSHIRSQLNSSEADLICKLKACTTTIRPERMKDSATEHQQVEDNNIVFFRTAIWNTEKQLLSDTKLGFEQQIRYQKPIDIGKDVILPEDTLKLKKTGFHGSDWCNKLRRRNARKDANYASEIRLASDWQTKEML
jgi:hypothetical protein